MRQIEQLKKDMKRQGSKLSSYDWKELERCLRSPSPVSGVAFDYNEAEHIALHSHEKGQLIYAVQGTMTVSTQGGTWVLLPARAVWVPAHVSHSIRVHTAIHMRTLYFDSKLPGLPKTCAVVGVSPFFRELILEILKEPRQYESESRAGHLASLIQMELLSMPTLPLHLPWPKDRELQRICSALRRNPSLRNRAEVWAELIGVSKRTLERMFQKELGMAFSAWRVHLLLLDAQVRLAQGHSSARIARALGYESQSAFIAMFKRYLGVSPMSYFADEGL